MTVTPRMAMRAYQGDALIDRDSVRLDETGQYWIADPSPEELQAREAFGYEGDDIGAPVVLAPYAEPTEPRRLYDVAERVAEERPQIAPLISLDELMPTRPEPPAPRPLADPEAISSKSRAILEQNAGVLRAGRYGALRPRPSGREPRIGAGILQGGIPSPITYTDVGGVAGVQRREAAGRYGGPAALAAIQAGEAAVGIGEGILVGTSATGQFLVEAVTEPIVRGLGYDVDLQGMLTEMVRDAGLPESFTVSARSGAAGIAQEAGQYLPVGIGGGAAIARGVAGLANWVTRSTGLRRAGRFLQWFVGGSGGWAAADVASVPSHTPSLANLAVEQLDIDPEAASGLFEEMVVALAVDPDDSNWEARLKRAATDTALADLGLGALFFLGRMTLQAGRNYGSRDALHEAGWRGRRQMEQLRARYGNSLTSGVDPDALWQYSIAELNMFLGRVGQAGETLADLAARTSRLADAIRPPGAIDIDVERAVRGTNDMLARYLRTAVEAGDIPQDNLPPAVRQALTEQEGLAFSPAELAEAELAAPPDPARQAAQWLTEQGAEGMSPEDLRTLIDQLISGNGE